LAESYHLSFGVPVVTLRPFNTFGPRQSARAIIPTIISQGLSGDVIRLGLLTPIRDLNFVSDTVEGFIKAAECPQAIGELFNIGSGRAITIGELAHKIVNLLGGGKEILLKKHGAPRRQRGQGTSATGKAESAWLGTQGCLEEGLVQTVAYIRDHLHHYKPQLYNVFKPKALSNRDYGLFNDL
jgi:nucleoside-diphosphate-sugar epimerase